MLGQFRRLGLNVVSRAAVAAGLIVLVTPSVASADHAGDTIGSPVPNPAGAAAQSKGEWEFLTNFPLGPGGAAPLGVDLNIVQRGEKRYLVVSTMTIGLRIVDVTTPDDPQWVADYGSSVGCPAAIPEALLDDPGDILAVSQGWENDSVVNQLDDDGVMGEGSVTGDGSLAIIGTDAGGRCHDGVNGGSELVDLSDPANPELLWLTRQAGENHNTSIDPYNDVVYSSTSDGNTFIDILDLRTCATKAQGGDGTCAGDEVRYQFPEGLSLAKGNDDDNGCHDITVRPDRIYCAAISATIVFDSSHLRNDDGSLTGDALPCEVVAADAATAGGAEIVSDCQLSGDEFKDQGLQNADLRPIAVIHHDGSKPPTQDLEISHEADPVRGSHLMMVTDERGGGLANSDGCPGGGVAFYDLRPKTLKAAPKDALGIPQPPMLQLSNGAPGIFRTANYPPGATMSCTAHVMEQWGDQRRVFLAWYLAGSHVFEWDVNYSTSPPTIRFEEPAFAVVAGPAGNSNSWTSHAYAATDNGDGTTTFFVAVTDISRGLDFLSVTLPTAAGINAPAGGGAPGGKTPGRTAPKVKGSTTEPDGVLAATGTGPPIAVLLSVVALAALALTAMRRGRLIGSR